MKNLIYIPFLVLALYSCVPAYTPNMVNTPLFSSQNEIQLAIGTGTSGIDAQTGYAITDNFGIIANGSYANRSDTDYYHKHSFIEFGGGYYNTMNESGHIEIIGGYGLGTVDAEFESGIFYAKTKTTFNRIFIQPSVGTVSDVFEFAFTPRFVFVNVKNPFDSLNTYHLDPFIEPTITLKVGWKYIKFVTQFGLSLPLTPYTYYTNQPFMFSMSLVGKIPGKKKDSNEYYKE